MQVVTVSRVFYPLPIPVPPFAAPEPGEGGLPRRSQTKAGLFLSQSQIKPGKDKSRQTKPDQARMFFCAALGALLAILGPNQKSKTDELQTRVSEVKPSKPG